MALYGCGRQPLVPEHHGYLDMSGEVPGKGAGRLGTRTFGAVEIEGKTDHQRPDLILFNHFANRLGVCGELAAPDGVVGGGDAAGHVGERHANGLGADVEAEQPCLAREKRRQILDVGDRSVGHRGRGCGTAARLSTHGPFLMSEVLSLLATPTRDTPCKSPGSAIPASASIRANRAS